MAVIADIVESREIPNRSDFQRRLKQSLDELNQHRDDSLLSPFTLTLGDEFQAVYSRFDHAFRDLIDILVALSPHRLRVALAYGPLSTEINPKAALEMDGRAFHDARETLEKLKKEGRSIVQVSVAGPFDPDMVNLGLRLLANAMESWKENSLRIFRLLLNGKKTDEIAESLEISRRAVNKNIASHHLGDYVDAIEMISEELDHALGLCREDLPQR